MGQVTNYIQGVASSISNAIGVWSTRTPNGDVQGVVLVDQQGNPQAAQNPSLILTQPVAGSSRSIQVVTRRRAMSVQAITQASNSAAGTWYFSTDMYVDPFSEMVLIASLNGAGSGTPANFQMKLQISDAFTNLGTTGFIDHPSGAITVASPQITTGAFAIAQYTNFASLVRVAVQWSTAWTSATNVVVIMHAKS